MNREPLTRREVAAIAAWFRAGVTITDEIDQPWAQRIVAKLRAVWLDAPYEDDAGPDCREAAAIAEKIGAQHKAKHRKKTT